MIGCCDHGKAVGIRIGLGESQSGQRALVGTRNLISPLKVRQPLTRRLRTVVFSGITHAGWSLFVERVNGTRNQR